MAEWREAPDLRDLAQRIVAKREDIAHVDPNEVLFLWEMETTPKKDGRPIGGRCYSNKDKPIGYFTGARFTLVLYHQHTDHMNEKQRALLVWHELKHIPALGDNIVPHDVQDFAVIIREAGYDWSCKEDVPDILT